MSLKLRNKQVPFLTAMKPGNWFICKPLQIVPSPVPTIKGNVIHANLFYLTEFDGSLPPVNVLTAMIRDNPATEVYLPGNQTLLQGLTVSGDMETSDKQAIGFVCVFRGSKVTATTNGSGKFNVWEIYEIEAN